MPTLNLKLLLRVLAATVVVVVGLVVLNQVQANRVPDALLWQANAAAEKGKTDKAIFYMRQYLEFRPDDYDMAVKLADLMLERAVTAKDITNAHFLYERVLRKAPQRSDVGAQARRPLYSHGPARGRSGACRAAITRIPERRRA